MHGEGKTTISICLGLALAMDTRRKVLLVDGNMRNPSIHTFFRDEDLQASRQALHFGSGGIEQAFRETVDACLPPGTVGETTGGRVP